MNSSNITVTDARLKRAIKHGVDLSGVNKAQEIREELTDKLTVQVGKIIKWYTGTNTMLAKLDNNEQVECLMNYNYLSREAIISAVPRGDVKQETSTGKYYITPLEDTYVNILQYNSEANEDKYCIIGFTNNRSETCNHTPSPGEILLQVGDNKISITRERINIMTDNLFINGIAFKEEEYYTKTEIDSLLQGLPAQE